MKRFPVALAVAAFAVMTATSAFAQQGVEVNGLALNLTSANNDLNAAIGNNSTAKQAIGVINGNSKINGLALNLTSANNDLNAAIGNNSVACQAVGVIGSVDDACKK
jgi:hypothetical protein